MSATVGALISDDAVTVLGRLALGLPFEHAAIIRLEALVLGRADAHGLALDASLVNSHIVGIPIVGDLRLRVRTQGAGAFAFSAGGFHPAFPVPDGMAGMRRIGTSISPGPMLQARLEAYLAITTNSAQVGARVDISAGLPGFRLRGHGAFDALFVFEPFRFETTFQAEVCVEVAGADVAGVGLHVRLSGPGPWRFKGHATISVLFLDVDVDIPELTWGPDADTPLPEARDPVAVLAAEIARPENWSATSQGVPGMARLRPTVGRGVAAVHPLATLGMRQRAVPLGVELRRMDGVLLSQPVVLSVHAAGAQLAATGPESFMRQQFADLDDNARLAGAGFETWPGGFDLHPDDHVTGTPVPKEDRYELRVIQDDQIIRPRPAAVEGTALAGHGRLPLALVREPMVTFAARAAGDPG
jgi:hypothetical protein